MNVYSLAEHEGMVVESEPCHVKVKIVKLTMLRSGTSRVCHKFSNYHRKNETCPVKVLQFFSFYKIIILQEWEILIFLQRERAVFRFSSWWILCIVVLDMHSWSLGLNTSQHTYKEVVRR